MNEIFIARKVLQGKLSSSSLFLPLSYANQFHPFSKNTKQLPEFFWKKKRAQYKVHHITCTQCNNCSFFLIQFKPSNYYDGTVIFLPLEATSLSDFNLYKYFTNVIRSSHIYNRNYMADFDRIWHVH